MADGRWSRVVGRAVVSLAVASAVELGLFVVAYVALSLAIDRVECPDGDCQPQYFFAIGVLAFFVIIPATYLLGCVAIAEGVFVGLRGTAARGRTVAYLLGCLVLLTVGLVVSLPMVSGTSGSDERMFRYQLWFAGVVLGPIVLGAAATIVGLAAGWRDRAAAVGA